MSLLGHDFMQRALIAALLTGLAAPAVGTYLVQRRLAPVGGGLGPVALTGVAGGLLTGLAGSTAANLYTYLFGSITTVSTGDLWVIGGLAGAVLVICVGLQPQLFAVCQDEDYARASGVPVRLYSILIAIMAAAAGPLALRTVGVAAGTAA